MKDEKLKYQLTKIMLCDCVPIIEDYIYYIKTPVRQRVSCGDGRYYYDVSEYEFLIIAEEGEKQAIILRCDDVDLHWYVLRHWRGKHVLSNALRTGVIQKIWPENKSVTCCYNWNDNFKEKRRMTMHLAEIAGLEFKED